MKRIEIARKHLKLGEYDDALDILYDLYEDNSFDIDVLCLMLDTYHAMYEDNINFNYEDFIDIYDRILNINEDGEYQDVLDYYCDFYNVLVNMYNKNLENMNIINDINSEISKFYINNWSWGGNYNGVYKTLHRIIFKTLGLKLERGCKFLKTSYLENIVSADNGGVTIRYTFSNSDIDHFSKVSVGGNNYNVSYTTSGGVHFSNYDFEFKDKNMSDEGVKDRLNNLLNCLKKKNKSDKIANMIYRIVKIAILLILIGLFIKCVMEVEIIGAIVLFIIICFSFGWLLI